MAIEGGAGSISLMPREDSPNPSVQAHHPATSMAMGDTAEVVAQRYQVSRASQDEYALLSQQRTARAQTAGPA